ncbi:putative DNA-binding protein [Serratia fonticola AU-P3(3)]|nr:putative DNA-binding protein [Serratia fonticola AU-P3(3)]
MESDAISSQKALGAFLRAHRERITPEMLGLPTATRRRTSGLRREELAQISGISATWYTWIEQGREVSISPYTLARIATALRLSHAERHYLFTLAHITDPEKEQPQETVNAAVLQSVHQITVPCYLLDLTWNMLAWNPQAEELFCDWLKQAKTPTCCTSCFFTLRRRCWSVTGKIGLDEWWPNFVPKPAIIRERKRYAPLCAI